MKSTSLPPLFRVAFRIQKLSVLARGAMVARQILTLKIEVRVLAGEYLVRPVVIVARSKSSQEH